MIFPIRNIKRYSYKYYMIGAFLALLGIIFFCEYLVYYVVLVQCEWPVLDPHKVDRTIPLPVTEERPVYAMFLADTHLLGSRKGHWFDKLKREWQMYRTFQTAITLYKPDVVFILGDIFDEGMWSSSNEFDAYIDRFTSLFSVSQDTLLYVVAGNHDIGFHYAINPYMNQRFVNGMKAPSVRRISMRDNHFVLINSMALEGDGCFLCKPTEIAVNNIAKQLKCAKRVDMDCVKSKMIKQYSRPILLQHYPMYRESDEMCNELDQAPDEIKDVKFRERWECLSKEASEQLLDILKPRLIVNGHTHHGCSKIHKDDILEITIPSFSWRNKDNPSFLLGAFKPNNYALSKCYMPVETTVIKVYVIGVVCTIICLIFKFRQKINSHNVLKLH